MRQRMSDSRLRTFLVCPSRCAYLSSGTVVALTSAAGAVESSCIAESEG